MKKRAPTLLADVKQKMPVLLLFSF